MWWYARRQHSQFECLTDKGVTISVDLLPLDFLTFKGDLEIFNVLQFLLKRQALPVSQGEGGWVRYWIILDIAAAAWGWIYGRCNDSQDPDAPMQQFRRGCWLPDAGREYQDTAAGHICLLWLLVSGVFISLASSPGYLQSRQCHLVSNQDNAVLYYYYRIGRDPNSSRHKSYWYHCCLAITSFIGLLPRNKTLPPRPQT